MDVCERLVLNDDKTKFMLFKLTIEQNKTIRLCDADRRPSQTADFLGLVIDEKLNWCADDDRLHKRLGSVSYSLLILKRYVDVGTLRTVYLSNIETLVRKGDCGDARTEEYGELQGNV
ncbi:hypothetical protein HHI36_013557 [Cryptolaemus montrouzieri]|uniref:Reverse transcriptase n=1 Tax=Cryptolaemus montrouzieri TaxID=559131 RepID=A0ABD2NHV3_9CUCU